MWASCAKIDQNSYKVVNGETMMIEDQQTFWYLKYSTEDKIRQTAKYVNILKIFE